MQSYLPPPSTEILIAATPSVGERLTRVLQGHELVFAQTSRDVMSHLSRKRYGMVIVRGHSLYRKIPILCVLAERGRLSEVAVEGLDHAVKAMTANGFLDLSRFPDDEGGNARIRRIVDYLILINGDLQAISEVQDLGRVRERRKTAR